MDALLEHTVAEAIEAATRVVPSLGRLSLGRQIVLIDMAVNLGERGLAGFRKMLAAIARGDFETAATEMAESRWARQVGDRAVRNIETMRTGRIADLEIPPPPSQSPARSAGGATSTDRRSDGGRPSDVDKPDRPDNRGRDDSPGRDGMPDRDNTSIRRDSLP